MDVYFPALDSKAYDVVMKLNSAGIKPSGQDFGHFLYQLDRLSLDYRACPIVGGEYSLKETGPFADIAVEVVKTASSGKYPEITLEDGRLVAIGGSIDWLSESEISIVELAIDSFTTSDGQILTSEWSELTECVCASVGDKINLEDLLNAVTSRERAASILSYAKEELRLAEIFKNEREVPQS